MGIYFSNIRSILEVKRKLQNQDQEEDLENEDEVQPNSEDEPTPPEDNNDDEGEQNEDNNEQDPYSMDIEDEDEETPEDNNDDGEENNETEPQDNNPEDEGNEDDTESEDNADGDGYSMDVEDGEDDTTEEDPSAEEGDNTTDDESGEQGELQSLEDDLFKDLSPEQMNIKLLEIKKQYLEVYTTITDILSRTNKIPKTTENIKVLEFVTNKLMELKELVQFYLSNTFDTKTYTENLVNYQQYLVVLNTVNRLLKEINTKKGK